MKNTVKRDQVLLESLVSKYGKSDVIKYIKKLNESVIADESKLQMIDDNYGLYELESEDLNEVLRDLSRNDGSEDRPYDSILASLYALIERNNLPINPKRTIDYSGRVSNMKTYVDGNVPVPNGLKVLDKAKYLNSGEGVEGECIYGTINNVPVLYAYLDTWDVVNLYKI